MLQTMVDMNKVMDPMKTAKTMQEFEKQNMKMEMTEELSKTDIYICILGFNSRQNKTYTHVYNMK